MIQPKVSVDVDSTNTSYFTNICSIGGLDPYNRLFPNFYQDVFKEGYFAGREYMF
jgi:hypothetical protein